MDNNKTNESAALSANSSAASNPRRPKYSGFESDYSRKSSQGQGQTKYDAHSEREHADPVSEGLKRRAEQWTEKRRREQADLQRRARAFREWSIYLNGCPNPDYAADGIRGGNPIGLKEPANERIQNWEESQRKKCGRDRRRQGNRWGHGGQTA